MITVTPQGSVYLCRTPLEKDYKHQLTFTNATNQAAYFATTVKKTYTDFVYIRKDNQIVVDENIENIRDCNYLFYRNTGFTNRIFYCFITNMEYVSEESTRITFETDVFQTWYFDLEYKQCFVEREHVDDDTIGKHTVPEGLETGEYVINDIRQIPLYETASPSDDWVICFVATNLPVDNPITFPWFSNPYREIGGVYMPLYMFAVKSKDSAANVIRYYNNGSHGNAIQNIYMIPAGCVDSIHVTWGGGETNIWQVKQNGYDSPTLSYPLAKEIDTNYIPKNNKLYTFPYCYFYVDNNGGSSANFKWEDFPLVTSQTWSTDHPIVYYENRIIPTTSLSAKLYFTNYKKYDTNTSAHSGVKLYNYGLNYGKVPVCAWTTDYFTNWLTQNGVNMLANIATSAVEGGMSLYKFGPETMALGATVSALASTVSAVSKTYQASLMPDQAKGDANSGDFTFSYYRNKMNLYAMTIRKEYAQIIDGFFNLYGYKVNTLKTPSITGRRYWNYVKTIDCNIEGDIPQDDLMRVRDIFNTGCTFWHDASKMYNYSLTNDIITQ